MAKAKTKTLHQFSEIGVIKTWKKKVNDEHIEVPICELDDDHLTRIVNVLVKRIEKTKTALSILRYQEAKNKSMLDAIHIEINLRKAELKTETTKTKVTSSI